VLATILSRNVEPDQKAVNELLSTPSIEDRGIVINSLTLFDRLRRLHASEILLQDLRYSFRTLRRDRVFASVAVLILALGIGANVAVFSVVNTILLRPLPFHDPQQLAWFAGNNGSGGLSDTTYQVLAYEAYQRSNRSFQELTAFVPYYSLSETKLIGAGEPKPVSFVWVAGNFFQTLGIQPALGRLFTPDESVKGGRPAVLLSYPFWQRQFGANPAIVGQSIRLDQDLVTVVGVLPATFDFGAVFAPGSKMDFFRPAFMEDIRTWGHMLSVVGRLKPGVTVAQAQAECNILFPQLKGDGHPYWDTDVLTTLSTLKEYVSGKMRRSLIVLWCAVGLILLIVCVNLSNLLLARAAARGKEFAMRTALGAGRGRLIRQLLVESLVLSSLGVVLGLMFAYAATSYLAHQGSIALPLLSSVGVDPSGLLWTLFIGVVATVLFGLVPASRISAGNLQEAIKDAGPAASQGKKHERLRAILVISEVALSCVLLVGAGLLLRSFLRVLDVDLGFNPSHAAALKIDYNDGGNRINTGPVLRNLLARIVAIPGIESAGISDMLPLDRNRSWDLEEKGKVYPKERNSDAFVYIVTPGYLDAMGMRLREGRDFTWQDTYDSEHVIIINQAAARREWPGEDPIGRLAEGIGEKDTRVIGVISDVRESSVEEASSPEVYVPITQSYPEGAELVVRTKLPPEVLAFSVMSTLRSINPGQPATEFRPIQQLVDHAVSPRRFFVVLVAAFAILGLLLASLGIYGVISYSVTRQTQEIGIRMALGATPTRVQIGVIVKTLRLTLIGMAVGIVASFAVARTIASLLFGTEPTDPATFTGMVLLLSTVAFVAGYIPARRASRINPMTALRNN
jgi:predicted permease